MEKRYAAEDGPRAAGLLAARVRQAAGIAARRRGRRLARRQRRRRRSTRALDKLAKTQLGDTDERMALVNADRAAFEASKDPAVQFAVAIMPTVLKLEQEGKTRAGDGLVARPVYLQAMADYKKSQGKFVYPDANSSLRITFGNVTGYTKSDGSVQAPFTTAGGGRGQGHRQGAVRRAAGAARRDQGQALRRPGRPAAGHGAGELPVRPRHHRRQLRLAGARRAAAGWSAWRSTATGSR